MHTHFKICARNINHLPILLLNFGGLSQTPCWKRVQKLEMAGVITGRVAIVDPAALGLGLTVFVEIEAADHTPDWRASFAQVVADYPEIQEVHRMAGEVDYLLKVAVSGMAAYDAFYKRMIAKIEIRDVSSVFAMEQIKYTTELPLDYMQLDNAKSGDDS